MTRTHARPLIVDVKRNSLDDGPGIRSVVFFKGCPLRCDWCQNPEAISRAAELQREPERCSACGACAAACPEGVARPAAQGEPSSGCRLCGGCEQACPSGARRVVGEAYDEGKLLKKLLRDKPFYRRSGGGVTLSGGEPAFYPKAVGRIAAKLREEAVQVLLETSGFFGWKAFERDLLPHLSTIYFDLKIADDDAHCRFAGKPNARIRANLRRLVEAGFPDMLPRIPLVPGITDGEENLESLAAFLLELGLPRVALLPYNPLWLSKRRALGFDLPYQRSEWMTPDEVERCRAVVGRFGLEVV